MIEILRIALRTLHYGNYGIFLLMGHAGFILYTTNRRTGSKLGRKRALRFWYRVVFQGTYDHIKRGKAGSLGDLVYPETPKPLH